MLDTEKQCISGRQCGNLSNFLCFILSVASVFVVVHPKARRLHWKRRRALLVAARVVSTQSVLATAWGQVEVKRHWEARPVQVAESKRRICTCLLVSSKQSHDASMAVHLLAHPGWIPCGSRQQTEDTFPLSIGFRSCPGEEPVKRNPSILVQWRGTAHQMVDESPGAAVGTVGETGNCGESEVQRKLVGPYSSRGSWRFGQWLLSGVAHSTGGCVERVWVGVDVCIAKIVLGIGDKAKTNNTGEGFSSQRQQHVVKYLQRIVQQQIRTLVRQFCQYRLRIGSKTDKFRRNHFKNLNFAPKDVKGTCQYKDGSRNDRNNREFEQQRTFENQRMQYRFFVILMFRRVEDSFRSSSTQLARQKHIQVASIRIFVEEFEEIEDFSLKSSIGWRVRRNRGNSCAQNLETSRRSDQQQKKCRRAIGQHNRTSRKKKSSCLL
ncbi:unnamed protein product [Caenorhabditis brenneri]